MDGARESEGCVEGDDEAVGFDVGVADGVNVVDGPEEGPSEVEGLLPVVGAILSSRSIMLVCVDGRAVGSVAAPLGCEVEGDEVGESDVAFDGA